MRPVIPSGNFPDNVKPAKFAAPEGMEEQVNDTIGLVHVHPNTGQTVAIEFMFELSEEELLVLQHERFITMTVMADHLHPFSIQTSYPFDEKYRTLKQHTHVCKSNIAHEEPKWWQCENPRHHSKDDRDRECDDCWRKRTGQEEEDGGEGDAGPVV